MRITINDIHQSEAGRSRWSPGFSGIESRGYLSVKLDDSPMQLRRSPCSTWLAPSGSTFGNQYATRNRILPELK